MKNLIKHFSIAATIWLVGAVALQAQQRYGGGGGGGGGFGGFGGGGGGGGNGFRNAYNSGSSSTAYNNNGTVGSAMIYVDPDTHNIVVTSDSVTAEQISNVIASLDAPKPQVLIKVVFMEVDLNNASAIGVQGSYTGGSLGSSLAQATGFMTNFALQNVTTTANGTTTTTPTLVPTSITPTYQSFNMANSFGLPQSLSGATGSGGLYQVLGNDFTATLQAIATAGKAQVLSRPSVLARDGQLAQIVVGQSIYLPSGVTFASAGSTTVSTYPTINGSYQNVGIILNVTPFIGDNSLVEMIVQPETSSVDTSSPGQVIATAGLLGSPIYAPNLDIRSADTVVVTPDAQPVVIGGLISGTKSSADSKVPILGDIPILGNLFKFSAKSASKTELLIFLTPHIVESPSQLVPLSTRETGQASSITNSVSEQELDQYLERVPVKKQ